ncbi:MAG: glycoside hydrolase family 5 protein [Oscillospiraceae bacterium]
MKNRITAVALMALCVLVMLIVPAKLANDSDGTSSESTATVTTADSAAQNGATTTPAANTPTTAPPADADSDAPAATTTPAGVTDPQSPPAPAKTPVAAHGQLSISGANVVDVNGDKFQLAGMSTHGIGWFPDAVSEDSFKVLRDDWGCNVIRLAMYIEESWGGSESCYLQDKDRNYALVTEGIDACIDLGMYVVVDWHVLNPGDPSTHTADAQAFFEKLAKKYGDCPNIIYEICNEPNGNASWEGSIKPYAESVTKSIRNYDDDAIIVCGTPTWSQEIDKAAASPLPDKNTVYALHFYANTHTDWLRARLTTCYNSGLPVLVTEFGTCDASGNSGFNADQTHKWIDLLNDYSIGYMNWSFCNKPETASAFVDGTNLAAIKAGTSQLTESGTLIREILREEAGL